MSEDTMIGHFPPDDILSYHQGHRPPMDQPYINLGGECGCCGEGFTPSDIYHGDLAEMVDPNVLLLPSMQHQRYACHAECGISRGFEPA